MTKILRCKICGEKFGLNDEYDTRTHIMAEHTVQERIGVCYDTKDIDTDSSEPETRQQ